MRSRARFTSVFLEVQLCVGPANARVFAGKKKIKVTVKPQSMYKMYLGL